MDHHHIQFCIHEPPTNVNHGRPIDLLQIQNLFQETAFWAQDRRLEDWAIAIENSNPLVTVWNQEQLIGFARATSDCIYRATIWDVAIHPDYQGTGLGGKLVETILSHPRVSQVERVYLMTTYKRDFYAQIGFEVNDTTTMVLHNQPLSTPQPPAVRRLQEDKRHR